jgi:hypothetical protein
MLSFLFLELPTGVIYCWNAFLDMTIVPSWPRWNHLVARGYKTGAIDVYAVPSRFTKALKRVYCFIVFALLWPLFSRHFFVHFRVPRVII